MTLFSYGSILNIKSRSIVTYTFIHQKFAGVFQGIEILITYNKQPKTTDRMGSLKPLVGRAN